MSYYYEFKIGLTIQKIEKYHVRKKERPHKNINCR